MPKSRCGVSDGASHGARGEGRVELDDEGTESEISPESDSYSAISAYAWGKKYRAMVIAWTKGRSGVVNLVVHHRGKSGTLVSLSVYLGSYTRGGEEMEGRREEVV